MLADFMEVHESCGKFSSKDIHEKRNLMSRKNNTSLPKVSLSPDNRLLYSLNDATKIWNFFELEPIVLIEKSDASRPLYLLKFQICNTFLIYIFFRLFSSGINILARWSLNREENVLM